MTDEFGRKLQEILCTHLTKEVSPPLPMDVSLQELGLESLSSVNLVLDLEDTFGIEFPDGMLTEATFHTVASLESALRSLLTTESAV